METVGDRLKLLREKKRFTMLEMAQAIGAPNNAMVNNWEKGHKNISVKYLEAYAKYFNVSIDWIRSGDFNIWLKKTIYKEIQRGHIYDAYELTPLQKAIYEFARRFGVSNESYKKGNKIDLGDYTFDIGQYLLFGFPSFEVDTTTLQKNGFDGYQMCYTYEKLLHKKAGYDSDKVIYQTIELFNKDLRDMKDIYEDDSDFPNINLVIDTLEKKKEKQEDIPAPIAEAILKLLD